MSPKMEIQSNTQSQTAEKLSMVQDIYQADKKKMIIVSNRLPVTLAETLVKSSGGLVSAMESMASDSDLSWIGWPGKVIEDKNKQHEWTQKLEEEFDYTPVFLTEKEVEDYYDGYANSCLWPTFHYIPNYLRRDSNWWKTFEEVNKKFAETVLEKLNPGDTVWVHDYHLMLVPKYLKDQCPDITVGFFLHTPFPSYEVFRCIPERIQLLEGLLGSDLIGFHTSGYLRHFQSCLLRLLSLESQCNGLRYQDRNIQMEVFPIGIYTDKFKHELKTEPFQHSYSEIESRFEDKKLILNVERLDYTKGLPSRLQAIDEFLDECDENQKNQLVFFFIAVPSRNEVEEYQQLREEIEGLVGHINGRHANLQNTPIHFVYNSVPFSELCALYSRADVMMVTPYIDGMNLVAKEYVACREHNNGVLVLSEFAGAAEELVNAVKVNPYDTQAMKQSLNQALSMHPDEQKKRMELMRERVLEFNATYWANNFSTSLAHNQEKEDISKSYKEILSRIQQHLIPNAKTALFLDYDGTLRKFESHGDKASPDDELNKILDKLEMDFDGMVFIISGRSAHDLNKWFGNRLFHLIGEHGYVLKKPGSEFENLTQPFDLSWKENVKEQLRPFVGTTPGSFVEEKKFSVVWHYRQVDPEFGKWKAQQAVSEICEMTANMPVSVSHGHKIVEISSIYVNKGTAVSQIINEYGIEKALCAGDDATDETMFRLEDPRIKSLKVGDGDTQAQMRVDGVDNFRRLLKDIIR